MDKFIKLNTSFRQDEQPDFEAMGIKPDTDDFDESSWEPMIFNVAHIETFNRNNSGSTNIFMISGGVWTVRESVGKIVEKIRGEAEAW